MPEADSAAASERCAEDGEEDDDAAFRLRNFQEVGILGHGSFGAVFLARRDAGEPSLALKVVSKALLAERSLEHTAVNERSVLGMSTSLFMVQLHASFETRYFCYFLMEAALGGNLCTIYEVNDFVGSEVHARFYVACVLQAFVHLHGLGWAHRDLKTENVLLDARGYGKLCDFGTAKRLSGAEQQLTHTICGTMEYMAPEIFHGHGYSFPADWWALGILAYELMVGETPFAAEENSEVFAKLRRGIERARFPRSSASWPDLVKGLCRRDPGERLPVLPGCAANVEEQAWFAEGAFDWAALKQCLMVPPHAPDVRGPEDLRNFSAEERELSGSLLEDRIFRAGWPSEMESCDTRSWSSCLL